MILEVQLTLPADHRRHRGSMCVVPPPSYHFTASPRAVRRITSGQSPQWISPYGVLALVPVPEHLERFLPRWDKRWAGDGYAWLPADIHGHAGNRNALAEFIASHANELVLEIAP